MYEYMFCDIKPRMCTIKQCNDSDDGDDDDDDDGGNEKAKCIINTQYQVAFKTYQEIVINVIIHTHASTLKHCTHL